MSRLLLAQDSLVGKLPIAENLRRDQAMLDTYAAAKIVRGIPAQDTGSDSVHAALGPLNSWSFDDEPVNGFFGDPISGDDFENTWYYAPHTYPVKGQLIRTQNVARFIVYNEDATIFGWDAFGDFYDPPIQMPLDDLMVLRLKKWVVDIPRDTETALNGNDVLVANHEMCQPLNASGSGPRRWLRWLAPPEGIGSNFLSSNVLNIVVFTKSRAEVDLFLNPDAVNTYTQVVNGVGDVYYYPEPPTPESTYWDEFSAFTAEYDEDKARLAAAYQKFLGYRVVMYIDHVRSGNNPVEADLQDSFADYAEDFLQAVATDLVAYNFSYGGRVDWNTVAASDFTGLITSHFGL